MFKFFNLLSISIPSNLKLSTHLMSRSGHIVHPGLKFFQYGITFVLSRFAAKPDMDLKSSIYLIQALSEDQVKFMMIFNFKLGS